MNLVLVVLVRQRRKKKEIKEVHTEKGKVKVSLCADDMVLYRKTDKIRKAAVHRSS